MQRRNQILYIRGIFRVVSRFPLLFVLYIGNLEYFLDSAASTVLPAIAAVVARDRKFKTRIVYSTPCKQ